jgi:hypothetical protein
MRRTPPFDTHLLLCIVSSPNTTYILFLLYSSKSSHSNPPASCYIHASDSPTPFYSEPTFETPILILRTTNRTPLIFVKECPFPLYILHYHKIQLPIWLRHLRVILVLELEELLDLLLVVVVEAGLDPEGLIGKR